MYVKGTRNAQQLNNPELTGDKSSLGTDTIPLYDVDAMLANITSTVKDATVLRRIMEKFVTYSYSLSEKICGSPSHSSSKLT